LLQLLFLSLSGHDPQRLRLLFPTGPPKDKPWKLAEAQGAEEGAEYSEAARGKRCGHIFRAGEGTYRCITCAADDTCVLCSRCFDASDHTGHQYQISLSSGNCGCCDCGDEEAWRLPLCCAIHTDNGNLKGKQSVKPEVPAGWAGDIRSTISRALDYFCDVISCSPEQLRLPKTEEGIRHDEEASRLHPGWYGEGDQPEEETEFALALWNDEKHTIRDVSHQVTRACRERDSFGNIKAHETNDIGRSVIKYSKDLRTLLQVSRTIEQIKVTVTIRSARDTFREQMCGTIVEWLADIAGCSFGEDNEILRHVVCEELLRPWHRGSGAYNADIGMKGIDDHEKHDITPYRAITLTVSPQGQVVLATEDDDEIDGDEQGQNEDEDGDEDEDYAETHDDENEDEEEEYEDMEIDLDRLREEVENNGDDDVEMGNADDELEVAEATLAGYPPPPPPPPPRQGESISGEEPQAGDRTPQSETSLVKIPRTPTVSVDTFAAKTPSHWQSRPSLPSQGDVPPHEDLTQRTRLDWMILFDLRLWKKTRTDLRDLYISTVVNVPQFKRIMGLRLSALYTALAQLYLIADREPDHSIVNLSLQLLTTPSITEEIVHRGNFLTKVMAILYTFLTTRQVGEPCEVNPSATLAFDAGSVTNRRLYHFFLDLRYLLQSEYVQNRIRTQDQYLLQFLDLVKLPQGICPNVRAVGEHVEYETDAWISASILMREINRLCRQFCEAFRHPEADDGENLMRAITATAISAIVHSTGIERKRFDQAEIKEYIRFKQLPFFDFEVMPAGQILRHRVVDFVVEKGSISFHHALHYTLSWLLECGRSMSRDLMRDILLGAAQGANEKHVHDRHLSNEDLLLAMFDYPLRVCAWLAQMKAGMWVRNGLSLRHQMSQYRGVSSRDFAYYRDIFLLQTAFVTCDPGRVLASIADRFGMVAWMSGNYHPRPGYEDAQIVDVAEEFVHLLIILIADRTSLTAIDADDSLTRENISRDIAHVLCFKPLSFSDLSTRLSDKLLETDMFQDALEEVATFRPPEGLNDTGTFELKPDFIDLVDPYSAHYNKNQRDEAESIYRNWVAKKTGKKPSDIVFEPKLRPIASGAFAHLSEFTKTPLFAQLVHHCLDYVLCSKEMTPQIPSTRVETFLQIVLHLTLVATLEDDTEENDMLHPYDGSFIWHALSKSRMTQSGANLTIIGLLQNISVITEYESCGAKMKHIIKIMWRKRPASYSSATESLKFPYERIDTDSPANNAESEQETKKKQALDRQARVMAQFQQQQQNFLNSQGAIDWGEEDFSDLESETQAETEIKVWKYPSGTCILCQEETNDSRLYGTFALVQDSGILRQTDIYDKDWIREVLQTPVNLDRSAESIRPFGVAGENRVRVRKLDSSGGEVITEKIGLSKGFSPKSTIRGPVTTGCGHIMHYSCFEVYYSATQRRHNQQVARNHPEHLNLKEFVCPLCKALGNAFLPIVWKGKEESYPGVLVAERSFDQFLVEDLRTILSQSPSYPLVIAENDKLQLPAYREIFQDYLTKSLVTPLSAKVDQLMVTIPPPSSHPFLPATRLPMPGIFPTAEDITVISPRPPLPPPAETPVAELVQIYRRLKKTLRTNQIHSHFSHPPDATNGEDLIYTDALIRSFGYSISALEIAQRGVESDPGATLLDKIPQLALTHLRVLAETASTYAAVGGVSSPSSKSRSAQEFLEMHRQKICQLFVGHPAISGTPLLDDVRNIEPLLGMDTFVFLAECSLSLLPVLNIEMRHLIQLCYVAEILKVAVTFILWNHALKDELSEYDDEHYLQTDSAEVKYAVARHFFDAVVSELKSNSIGRAAGSSIMSGFLKEGEDSSTPALVMALRRLIAGYALPFLRKTVILLHVQHGVDFPGGGLGDESMSELDRLTTVLQLPTLDEIFASFSPARTSENPWDKVVSGWIFHWNASRSGIQIENQRLWPSLSHPAIFELIGLPKNYDMLIEEANRRRCPKTKKELSDPSICLFCGDIFCSQAVCCMENKLGGCNQHLMK
jgi:E3 ubiquitin-protein ligase UBR1